MIPITSRQFVDIQEDIASTLYHAGSVVQTKTWQGQEVKGKPQAATLELENVIFTMPMPTNLTMAANWIKPNLPWAETHFLERVSGKPLNPPPSNEIWPFKQNGHADHVDDDGRFSHTYPERIWPKHAGLAHRPVMCNQDESEGHTFCDWGIQRGLRFQLGDLNDVVALLRRDPHTRQAFLPIWFPEDTGAVDGQRVPCTIGYHFMIRRDELSVTYMIRACDLFRHFRDDVYMAVRLAQWVRWMIGVPGVTLGSLTMHIMSMHVFANEADLLRQSIKRATVKRSERLLGAMASE